LFVRSFSVPATVTHGEEATGAMYVENAGPGDAGAFSVDIHGSCAQEAYSAAAKDVPGLAAGVKVFISVKFTFQSIGPCKVGATIDSDNLVAETDESNNEVSVDVTSQ